MLRVQKWWLETAGFCPDTGGTEMDSVSAWQHCHDCGTWVYTLVEEMASWISLSGAMLSPLHFHTGNAIHNHLRGEVKPWNCWAGFPSYFPSPPCSLSHFSFRCYCGFYCLGCFSGRQEGMWFGLWNHGKRGYRWSMAVKLLSGGRDGVFR